MTVTLDRPAAQGSHAPDVDDTCPAGLTWCTRHESDAAYEFHGSSYALADADRSGPKEATTETLAVTATRSDDGGVEGEPIVFVLPDDFINSGLLSDALGFTPSAAREFARAWPDAPGTAPGSNPAGEWRPGALAVIGDVPQTVTVVVMDGVYRDGHIQIHTDLSEAIDSGTPALECVVGDLVTLEVVK